MSKQSEEIKRYFNFHGIRNYQIGEDMGMSDALVSNMLHGRDSIGKMRAMKLHEVYGFDLEFLLTGKGQLVPDITMSPAQLKSKGETTPPPVAQVAAPLPPMVDSQADMVDILLGQVQQLTALIGQIRAENIALRKELNDKESLG